MARPRGVHFTATERAEIRARVFELHAQRKSMKEIAEELDISPETVRQTIIRTYRESSAPVIEHERKRDIELIEQAIAVTWPRVKAGTHGAVSDLEKLLARRARYLGLDAPQQVEATVTQTTQLDISISELLSQMDAAESNAPSV